MVSCVNYFIRSYWLHGSMEFFLFGYFLKLRYLFEYAEQFRCYFILYLTYEGLSPLLPFSASDCKLVTLLTINGDTSLVFLSNIVAYLGLFLLACLSRVNSFGITNIRWATIAPSNSFPHIRHSFNPNSHFP